MNERTLTVKGVGNASVKPDMIVISMTIENKDYSYESVMKKSSAVLGNMQNNLSEAGFKKEELKTTDFKINTDYESYKDYQGNWKSKFDGYKCIHRVKLELDFSMEKLNKTLKAISESGADPNFNIMFTVRDKAAVSEEVLKNAVKNAKDKAEILAQASGIKLGTILHIDYCWEDINFYSEMRITEDMCCDSLYEKGMNIEMTPDDIKASDNVTVIWSVE